MRNNKYLIWLILIMMGVSLSCEELGNESDAIPPVLPDLTIAQPDVSFFEMEEEGGEAFTKAAFFAQQQLDFILEIGDFYVQFIEAAPDSSAEERYMYWEWNYDITVDSTTGYLRLTAEELKGNWDEEWSLYVTADLPEGPSVENFLFMNGFIAKDGNTGEWYIMDPGEQTAEGANLSFNWEIRNNGLLMSSFHIQDFESTNVYTVQYERNEDEHSLFLSSSEQEHTLELVWNTTTREGYLEIDGFKECWDSTLADVNCGKK